MVFKSILVFLNFFYLRQWVGSVIDSPREIKSLKKKTELAFDNSLFRISCLHMYFSLFYIIKFCQINLMILFSFSPFFSSAYCVQAKFFITYFLINYLYLET